MRFAVIKLEMTCPKCFFPENAVMAGIDAIPQIAHSANRKGIVLYDGKCQLCRRSIRILKRLDWLKKIHCQDCRDIANLPVCEVPLGPEQMLEQMHVVAPDRKRSYAGFLAFRWMSWRLPLIWGIAPLLYLPGARWLGTKIYLWVASNRYHLVPCKDGVCSLVEQSGK